MSFRYFFHDLGPQFCRDPGLLEFQQHKIFADFHIFTDIFFIFADIQGICRYIYVWYSFKRELYKNIILFLIFAWESALRLGEFAETIWKGDQSRENYVAFQHILGFRQTVGQGHYSRRSFSVLLWWANAIKVRANAFKAWANAIKVQDQHKTIRKHSFRKLII